MNSKERLKRQGGAMSGRRTSTFDEAITFPLVMLAFGGAISSLMAEPERCARCGHPRKRVVFGDPHESHRKLGCIFTRPYGKGRTRCGCRPFVPSKGEP